MRAEVTVRPADECRGTALQRVATSVGDPIEAAHNSPLWLDDPAAVWFVESGTADVFLAERVGATPTSTLQHVVAVDAGRLVFGAAGSGDTGLQLVLKGLPGTTLRRVPMQVLGAPPAAESDTRLTDGAAVASESIVSESIRQLDRWIEEFAGSIARTIEGRPRVDARVAPGSRPPAGVVTSDAGVLWLSDACGQAVYLDLETVSADGPGLIPLTPDVWVRLPVPAEAAVRRSADLLRDLGMERLLGAVLADFHQMAASAQELNRRMVLADVAMQRRTSAAWRRRDRMRARSRLYAAVRAPQVPPGTTPLLAALLVVARHERVDVKAPERARLGEEPPGLQEILDFSGLRRRRVRLRPGDRWWMSDCGALLGFGSEDGRPLALLPGAAGRYRQFDPATGAWTRLTRKSAGGVAEDAWQMYQPMADSGDGASGRTPLLGVVRSGLASDFVRLAATGLFSGVLTLAPAVAIGSLVERVIPSGGKASLAGFALLLAGVALMAAFAHVLRGTALMRIEARIAARLSAALMDRVLRARPSALRGYDTGALGLRIGSFQVLRDRVAGAAMSALLSVLFLLPSFAAVFLYSARFGWTMLGLGMAAVLLIAALAAAQLGPHGRRLETSLRVGGQVLQFIAGAGKLRATRSEGSALAAWARLYGDQKRHETDAAVFGEHIAAVCASLPLLAGAAVFAVYLAGPDGMPIADFLVVFAVAGMFFNALAFLGPAFESLAMAAPTGAAVRPILAADLEHSRSTGRDIRLNGEVLLDRVSFRYDEEGPDVLVDVTIRASPGEFIAIVGQSGAGKSTLVRLVLGLDDPTSGGVYYDGHDLARLDPAAVRRQIGVVAQGSELQPVSILKNIIGETDILTMADAWKAARAASLDEDIAAMPMGMHTIVAEGGANVSGGQRQRLAVAAALVHEPRVVILDEATSWLDSVTQEKIMANIGAAAVTRIVIAHRLSTTRDANHIYVLDGGRVVQEGTFQDLSAAEGPFQDLMRRQMT